MPDELWQRIVRGIGDVLMAPEDLLSCMRYYSVIAVLSCVCTGWRRALLGPGADSLWLQAVFSAAHPVLGAQQSRALNTWVAAQGHRVKGLELYGGGWDLGELQRLTSSITGPCSSVSLNDITVPSEAAVISRTLSALPVLSLDYRGRAACVLPASVTWLNMHVALLPPDERTDTLDQTPFQRFLGCLRPLRQLQVLHLRLFPWRLTAEFVQSLPARHPQLQVINLHLTAMLEVGTHALEGFRHFTSVRLGISIRRWGQDDSMAALLQQLQGIQLTSLVLVAPYYTSREEALLARCSMRKLVLVCPTGQHLRLQQLPGVQIVYQPNDELW